MATVLRGPVKRSIQRCAPLPNCRQELGELVLEIAEDVQGIHIGTLADLLGLPPGLGDDLLSLFLGPSDQLVLAEHQARALAGRIDDLVRLFLGLHDHPLAFLAHAARLLDLLRHGDPELVDDVEKLLFINDRSRREWKPRPGTYQLFQAVNQLQDVDDLTPLPASSSANEVLVPSLPALPASDAVHRRQNREQAPRQSRR